MSSGHMQDPLQSSNKITPNGNTVPPLLMGRVKKWEPEKAMEAGLWSHCREDTFLIGPIYKGQCHFTKSFLLHQFYQSKTKLNPDK